MGVELQLKKTMIFWEELMLDEFLQLIQGCVMRKHKVDEWGWRGENNLQYKS